MSTLSATAARTRRAIILAGVRVLGANRGAPLADIATEAGVARSTFHRYFPDRASLETAIGELAEEEWDRAVERARLGEGLGVEACIRFFTALLDSLEVLGWWLHEGVVDDDPGVADAGDLAFAAAIERGHADGSMDASMSAEWINHLMWSLLFAVKEAVGEMGQSDFEVRQQAVRSFVKAISA